MPNIWNCIFVGPGMIILVHSGLLSPLRPCMCHADESGDLLYVDNGMQLVATYNDAFLIDSVWIRVKIQIQIYSP